MAVTSAIKKPRITPLNAVANGYPNQLTKKYSRQPPLRIANGINETQIKKILSHFMLP